MNPTIGSPGIGLAALGEADEQVADALDPDAAGPVDLLGRGDGRERALHVVDDAEPHDDGLGADRAVADGGVEVVEGVVVVVLRDLGDRRPARRPTIEVRARRRSSRSSDSRPWTMFSSRSLRLNHWRIFSRAWLVLTIFIQSRDGPCSPLVVTISTMSPFLSR